MKNYIRDEEPDDVFDDEDEIITYEDLHDGYRELDFDDSNTFDRREEPTLEEYLNGVLDVLETKSLTQESGDGVALTEATPIQDITEEDELVIAVFNSAFSEDGGT